MDLEEIPQSPLPTHEPHGSWPQGRSREFLKSVYRRATQTCIVAALIAMGMDQRTVALGLLSGTACALFSTWSVEATVRLLFRGGGFPGPKLALAAMVKLPFMLAGLVGIAWASYNGIMNIFAVVGGVLLVHGTLFLMAVAAALTVEDRKASGR